MYGSSGQRPRQRGADGGGQKFAVHGVSPYLIERVARGAYSYDGMQAGKRS
jgi:hypothetical protein